MSDDKSSFAPKQVSKLDANKPSMMPSEPSEGVPKAKKAIPAKRAATKKIAAKKAPAKKAVAAKKGKPQKATAEAPRSKRTFPQRTLEEAHKLAHALRQNNGGNSWSPQHLAASMEQSARASGFFYLTAASRDYGLTTGTRDAPKI